MPDYQLAPPYSLSGKDAGLSTLMDLYKTDLKAFQDQEKEQFNRAKGTVASLIDSYHKADSQALQQDIVNMMKSYTSVLPRSLKAAVGPYIAHGPTSPMAEKARQFKNFMGDPPKLPPLNEAPGEAAEMENLRTLTTHHFASEDYERKREIFMLGADAARPKSNLFMFPNNKGAAVRNKDGRISFLSMNDLNLKELEDRWGITPREVIINNGQIPTGKKGWMISPEGRKLVTEEYFNIAEQTYHSRVTDVQQLPTAAIDRQYPSRLVKLAMDWKNPHPDDEGLLKLKERAVGGDKLERAKVANELAAMFPGYNFTILDKKAPLYKRFLDYVPLITWLVSADNEDNILIPVKGHPTKFTKGSGGTDTLYYDYDLDRVYDSLGKYIGNFEQATAIVKAR